MRAQVLNGQVNALAIDTEAAFLEYLDMFYNLGFAGRAMKRIGAIDFVTTVAPGLRDVILTGKIKERVIAVNKDGSRVYDAIVVDSPPTGRIGNFLDVTQAMADLTKTGPIRNQSDGVTKLLRSADTAVHLVTLLEAMPIQETIEAIVEAVPIVMQWPWLRCMQLSASKKSCSFSVPARTCSLICQTPVPEPSSWPRHLPLSIGPPLTPMVGRSALAAPISSAGVATTNREPRAALAAWHAWQVDHHCFAHHCTSVRSTSRNRSMSTRTRSAFSSGGMSAARHHASA